MKILERFSLKGKIALVTGGAGLYGRQIVAAVAEAGAQTYVASRNTAELEKMSSLKREEGYEVTALKVDLGNEESILMLKENIIEKAGHVDILINNAVLRPMKSWFDDASKFSESMNVNATGLFIITRAFGDIMAKQGNGSIINIASIQGMVGPDTSLYEGLSWNSLIPDYFFHKGGMINLTRFVAGYYGNRGVRCNCVSPGGYLTENMDKVFIKRYSERTFLGRMANSNDLMGVIVFLASDASNYITGVNIPVDGGYTSK